MTSGSLEVAAAAKNRWVEVDVVVVVVSDDLLPPRRRRVRAAADIMVMVDECWILCAMRKAREVESKDKDPKIRTVRHHDVSCE